MGGVVEVHAADRREVGCDWGGDEAVPAKVAIPVESISTVVRAAPDEEATCYLVLKSGDIVVVTRPYYKHVKNAFEAKRNGAE